MQSKFQNKDIGKWNPFYNFPEHIFSSTSIIRTFANVDKGSFPINPN
jgi:hypothetical protein